MLSSRVEQLITDHKGKPLFGLKASQRIGRHDKEPVYEDMPEPPVSPKLKDLVLQHEKRAKESSEFDTQPRQKPRAKFRDSFILDTKDEGLYSTFQENGFTDSNSVLQRPIIQNVEENQKNDTIIKSNSQSTIFQSKEVMRSDGSGNDVLVTGNVSSVNNHKPTRRLTRGQYTNQSFDDSDAEKSIDKVNSVTASIGKDTGAEITEITEVLHDSDRVDGNKVVRRNRTNGNFESIQKRFSQESFDQDSRRSSKEINGHERTDESPQPTSRSTLIRGDSIKALQNKFQQATAVSSCLQPRRSSKSDIISSSMTRQTEETAEVSKVNAPKHSSPTSFLDNSSKVTSLQDVLTRMRNADLAVENGDTDEDIEARALLNKFLGASAILHGMEQGIKSPTFSSLPVTTETDASHFNRVEKQKIQKSPTVRKNSNERELDNIWDKRQLHILLESCPDHDQRKKIRARLRQIMAQQKACADVVALQADTDGTTAATISDKKNGELMKPGMCCGSLSLKPDPPVVDDSGTESGEEVNQRILVQVQGALANLESALPALDPLRRSSVVELLTKLQTSLKLSSSSSSLAAAARADADRPTPPPRKCWNKKAASRQDRHTVGVSSEELQDARRWLEENGYADVVPSQSTATAADANEKPAVSACAAPRIYDPSCAGSASKQFRPVKFVPPPPKRSHYAEDYVPEPSKHSLRSGSFACPPVQHVRVVDNTDRKIRASRTSDRSGSTDSSGGVSDDDDGRRPVSSAQRLLQIASNDHGRKLRQGKRAKLKRPSGAGNTTEEERSSGDECSPREVGQKEPNNSGGSGGGVPPFEPKTASDQKYLALLRQARDEEKAPPAVYNPLHGKLQGNWGNRFGRIKTTFERGGAACASFASAPKKNLAKTFWHDICKCPSDDSIAYNRPKKLTSFKPVWSAGENGFSHATKSAFRPVAQKAAFLEPPPPPKPAQPVQPKSTQPPRHLQLPLYNSAVTTAHRPFVYSDHGKSSASQPWNPSSPCSGTSDPTSCSTSPSADFADAPQPSVTSRVMGSPQTASIVKGKTTNHYRSPFYPSSVPTQPQPQPPQSQPSVHVPRPPPRSPRLIRQQRSPTSSPVRMPSVLQKSESWHQMIMGQTKAAVRAPTVTKTPSSSQQQQQQRARHVPQAVRPYEGYLSSKDEIARKQNIVRQHLRTATGHGGGSGGGGGGAKVRKSSVSPNLARLNDDIDKVDDTFENLFKESTKTK